jgi:NAD(P)-dependent dehydrogenase (short-subunit alcohol dehydrogenase family)
MEPLLLQSDAGRAILVSSGAAKNPRAFWGAYAASKAGLEALGTCWAAETEQTNLRVNTLNPGATATRMRTSAFPGEDQSTIPLPIDIAPAFITLLSPDCTTHGKVLSAREMLGL